MSNPLSEIGNFINSILTSLFNLLPDSPFRDFFVFVDDYDILGMVNWIIPFDNFCTVLDTWLICVSAYYVFLYSKGLLSGKSSIISRIFGALFG